MKLYKREMYLKRIRGFYDDDLIKVITGIRRCGKSCLLLSIINELIDKGVAKTDVIYINLDKKGYKSINSVKKLEKCIDSSITNKNKKYIFIDEIQNVKDFEILVNAYREEGHSVFITGSNSYLLSGELVTKLTGRYIEFEIMPLTFNEYIDMKILYKKKLKDDETEFNNYIREGGFPKLIEKNSNSDKILYISELIDQIINKDIRKRKKIRNIPAFNLVKNFVINNFGSTLSVESIHKELIKNNIRIKLSTIYTYLEYLENAKIVYKCNRFDIKSKKSLKTDYKYYLATPCIYFANSTDARINYGQVLENIMFLQFKYKGFKISIGKIGNFECDFILRNDWNNYYYAQISTTIMDSKSTEDREYRSLELIKDNYPKYVFTMDKLIQKRNGIIHKNIIEYLKSSD